MSAPDKTKIVLVGPCKAGKSAIANLMGGLTDTLDMEGQEPTAGCRIVEIERDVPGRGLLAAEVWDVAGDPR
jgi:GTPase SAR1 family protein